MHKCLDRKSFRKLWIFCRIKQKFVSENIDKPGLMEGLPDQLLWEIFNRMNLVSERNRVALVCKRFYELERKQREYLRVGCGLRPANQALALLCARFPNLNRVEIVYYGWMSKLGKQLDDKGLKILSQSLPNLLDLTLGFCTSITDVGLGYLGSCTKLKALRLNFAPGIRGEGILPLIEGCRGISVLHLTRCFNDSRVEWLQYLGRLEDLEDLAIVNCRGFGEGDLAKLCHGWSKLKRLRFEVDVNYRHTKVYGSLALEKRNKHWVASCDVLEDLNLVNCLISPGKGLASVLGRNQSLVKLNLDMCIGIRDSDLISLSKQCPKLRSLSIGVPSDFSVPILMSNPLRLSDRSLQAFARNCLQLEEVSVAFADGIFPSMSSFTLAGILSLIERCPIRVLKLTRVHSFNDNGMAALSAARLLEKLELVQCQEVTDEGLQLVKDYPKLSLLSLCRCLGITDFGLRPLVGSQKLQMLSVECCPLISEGGTAGAANSVSFKQDFSWMF